MTRLTIENFKDSKIKERFELLHPKMREIAEHMAKWCAENEQPFVITEAVTTEAEDIALNRESRSHSESRAIDCRTSHWSSEFIAKFISYFTEHYGELGAFSQSDGERRFIVDKSKLPKPHLHIQLDTTFAIKGELT